MMNTLLLSILLSIPSTTSKPVFPTLQAEVKMENSLLRRKVFIFTKETKIFYQKKQVKSYADIPEGSVVEDLIYDEKTREVESAYFGPPKKDDE